MISSLVHMSLSSGVLLASWLLNMAEEMVVMEQISVMMPLHREFVGRVIYSHCYLPAPHPS
jgi:hypothetical protein